MSADYWLEIDTGGDELFRIDPGLNVTYNLGAMLRAAGFPEWKALIGAPASETAGVLDGVAKRLVADKDSLIAQFTPENGWGDWGWALKFVENFRDECTAHPKATVGGWL